MNVVPVAGPITPVMVVGIALGAALIAGLIVWFIANHMYRAHIEAEAKEIMARDMQGAPFIPVPIQEYGVSPYADLWEYDYSR